MTQWNYSIHAVCWHLMWCWDVRAVMRATARLPSEYVCVCMFIYAYVYYVYVIIVAMCILLACINTSNGFYIQGT